MKKTLEVQKKELTQLKQQMIPMTGMIKEMQVENSNLREESKQSSIKLIALVD